MIVKRNLPPLNALRVFEIAAKSESFSKAADTLCVTQSAVSKQIRLLEKHLGTILFERQGGAVILTTQGRQYLATITNALDTIETGSEKFYDTKRKETLTINIAPSLSALWMFSRVNDFHTQHPDIVLHINSSDDVIDWNRSDIDVAIRCLPYDKKHNDAELLLKERLVLISTTQQLQVKPVTSLNDLSQHQCISLNNRPQLWEEFFEQYQLDKTKIMSSFGCEHFHMVVQATLKHLGIGLAADFLCQDLIKTQQLVNPLNIKIASNYGYYLIIPPHKKDQKKVISFTRWIKDNLK